MDNVLDTALFIFTSLTACGYEITRRIRKTTIYLSVIQDGEWIANIKVVPEENPGQYRFWRYYNIGKWDTARKFLMEFESINPKGTPWDY